jgi:lipopolysaccharide biosynthesis regulator YciM
VKIVPLKKLEEAAKQPPVASEVVEEILIEEENEEEVSDIDEELKKKEQAAQVRRQAIRENMKKQIRSAIENDGNRYESSVGEIRSIFHHTKDDIHENIDELQIRYMQIQDQIL